MTPQRHRTWKHLPFLLATGFLIVGIASRLGGVPPAIEGERPELHASKHSGRWPGFAIIGSSGKCLAVAPSTGADANVQIATCNKGPEQLWRFNRRGEIRGSGNRCLTVVMQPGQNHGNVEVQACQGWAAQQWRIGPRGKIHGLHGRCLDVVDGRTEDGTNVQLFTCHNHIAQKWRTTKLTIVALGNKCVDRAGNGRTPGPTSGSTPATRRRRRPGRSR